MKIRKKHRVVFLKDVSKDSYTIFACSMPYLQYLYSDKKISMTEYIYDYNKYICTLYSVDIVYENNKLQLKRAGIGYEINMLDKFRDDNIAEFKKKLPDFDKHKNNILSEIIHTDDKYKKYRRILKLIKILS